MRTHFNEAIKRATVKDGIERTASAIAQRWRDYGDRRYYKSLCLTATWNLLEKKNEFGDDDELGYYLFGNRYTRNRCFWEVDSIIREDCGIKTFNPATKSVDFDKLENLLHESKGTREDLIKAIDSAMCENGNLTLQERCVLSLLFDLSCAEEHREDGDNSAWTVREVARAMSIKKKDVVAIKKRALNKLAPLLSRYS